MLFAVHCSASPCVGSESGSNDAGDRVGHYKLLDDLVSQICPLVCYEGKTNSMESTKVRLTQKGLIKKHLSPCPQLDLLASLPLMELFQPTPAENTAH